MAATNPAEILKQWLAAINGHDVSALAALMAADHVFVDSLGNRVQGAKSMEAGWRGYFALCRCRRSGRADRQPDVAHTGGGQQASLRNPGKAPASVGQTIVFCRLPPLMVWGSFQTNNTSATTAADSLNENLIHLLSMALR